MTFMAQQNQISICQIPFCLKYVLFMLLPPKSVIDEHLPRAWAILCAEGDDDTCFKCLKDYHTKLNYYGNVNPVLIFCRHYRIC
jgi:hypothetical protein